MFTTITEEKLIEYLNSLKKRITTTEFFEKIKSIDYFVSWAYKRQQIDETKFNRLNSIIHSYGNEPSVLSTKLKLLPTIPLVADSTSIKDSFLYPSIFTTPYINFLFIFIIFFVCGVAIFLFKGLKTAQPSQLSLKPSNSTRILAFQAKLSDSTGKAIDSKTDILFQLYNQPVGGVPLYKGGCIGENALTPRMDGNFNIKLGKDCGMLPLNNSIFKDNTQLYLGIKAGSDLEMLPRKQIANVGFATTSSKLQGLPPGNTTSSIPYINDDGDLLIDTKNAGIKSLSSSANFTIGSAYNLNLEANGDGNINLHTTDNGEISFKTKSKSDDKVRFLIANNGHIGINGADTSLFNVQVAGDIGPNFENIYDLGSPSNQWNTIYGKTLYQNGHQVCDTTNNCSGGSWSGLTSPIDNLSISMGENTTTLTYGASTSSNNLLSLKDSGYNTGTGALLDLETAAGSTLKPFHISASGTEALSVTSDGRVGIGVVNPKAKLHVSYSGSNLSDSYAGYFENKTLNYSTNGINKYGLYVASTGDFKAGTGTATNNYGIYINTANGADNNYDIYAASGASLTTSGTWQNASSRDLKENFTKVDSTDILNKINQLDLTTWNYKTDSATIKHLGPIAEDFYSIFNLGNSNKSISTIDPAGVALAGIQALNKKFNDRESNSPVDLDSEGDIQLKQNNSSRSYVFSGDVTLDNTYVIQTIDGKLITSIKAFQEIVASKTKTGILDAQQAVIHGSLFAKNVVTDEFTATTAAIDSAVAKTLNVSGKITSPIIETSVLVATQQVKTPIIETNQINPSSDNLIINLNKHIPSPEPQTPSSDLEKNLINKGQLAELIIKGLGNNTVTSIDAIGNIKTTGNITSETASINGSLTADSIKTEILQSNVLTANTASISGELLADTIKGRTIDDIHNQITTSSSSISDISNQVNSVQKLVADIKNQSLTKTNVPLSTSESNSSSLLLAKNTSSTNFDAVTISGLANIYKISVSDSLSIGNLIINERSISSLSPDLYLSSLGTIKFFDNSVIISKDGSITAQGSITAVGGVKTNTIQATSPSENVNILLENGTSTNNKFQVVNADKKAVASIDSNGSATFKHISLDKYISTSSAIIAAADNLTQNGEYSPAIETSSQTAGMGILPPHSNQVIIYNDSIKKDSLVYLTSTSSVPGNTLTVVKKEICEVVAITACRPYFKVENTTSALNEVTFNWLIIN